LLLHPEVEHVILDGIKEQHTEHVRYKRGYHFICCPAYRKAVLTGDVANFIESEIRRVCEPNHWTIGALTLQEDHVHLLVSASPAVSLSHIAHTLKGITAR
jgi:putative transposase